MLFFMIDLSLSIFSVPLCFCHHKSCLKMFFSSNHLTGHGTTEQLNVANRAIPLILSWKYLLNLTICCVGLF